jgi:23S rRNA pseudouridine1911/1915/1917 synthase
MAVVASGRAALTHYRILESFAGLTHLEVSLETGRTHQIRVHLAHLGFSIVGDRVYGKKARSAKGMRSEVTDAVKSFPRQALHARTLRLQHPEDQRPMEFHAPLPEDIRGLLTLLRNKTR